MASSPLPRKPDRVSRDSDVTGLAPFLDNRVAGRDGMGVVVGDGTRGVIASVAACGRGLGGRGRVSAVASSGVSMSLPGSSARLGRGCCGGDGGNNVVRAISCSSWTSRSLKRQMSFCICDVVIEGHRQPGEAWTVRMHAYDMHITTLRILVSQATYLFHGSTGFPSVR